MSQVFEADDASFEAEVMASERPVLVDFSATWCGPCKKLEPIIHEIAGDYEGRLKVVKVDIDKARNTASKFGVMSVPTVLLIQSGAIKEQIVEDQVTGLTFQFEVTPSGERQLRIYGDLPYGNREIVFDQNGQKAGSGTFVAGLCRPAWLTVAE